MTTLDIGVEGPCGAGKSTLLSQIKKNSKVKVTIYYEDYKKWHSTPKHLQADVITEHFTKSFTEVVEDGSRVVIRDRTGFSQFVFSNQPSQAGGGNEENFYPKLDYLFCLLPKSSEWCVRNVVKRGRRYELEMLHRDPLVFHRIWESYSQWRRPDMMIYHDYSDLYRDLLDIVNRTVCGKSRDIIRRQ